MLTSNSVPVAHCKSHSRGMFTTVLRHFLFDNTVSIWEPRKSIGLVLRAIILPVLPDVGFQLLSSEGSAVWYYCQMISVAADRRLASFAPRFCLYSDTAVMRV